jgi:hypothetical protein
MAVAIGGTQLRESPLISQGDLPFVGVYPHTSPHRGIGFTARRKNRAAPGLYVHGICPKIPSACDRVTAGQVWQKCGKEGYPARGWMWLEIWVKLLQTDSAPSNRNSWRAPPERCRHAGGEKDPRGIFHLHERGAGWSTVTRPNASKGIGYQRLRGPSTPRQHPFPMKTDLLVRCKTGLLLRCNYQCG